MLIGSVSELLLVYHLRLNRLSEYQSLTLYFVNATLYKSILVICQEKFKMVFDMFFLKKGALHPRS